MEGELGLLGHHSPAGSSCVSSEVFGSPIPASPRDKLLLDSSPSSCVSDGRSKGGRPSSPTRMGKALDSPASCVSDGRYVSPLRVSAEQEREAREAEMLLRAIAERYDECFLRLRDATAEVAELRLERLHLRAENVQLSLLLEELEANRGNLAYAAAPAPPLKPAEEAAARGGAPKSISIRSKCYLSQMNQPQGEAEAQRLRVRPPPPIEEAAEDEAQGDGEVEVEAYRQGTHKTELCNKWEQGTCPYADRCRFAHGLHEMRPVIRHPRYKTLPCQMFVAASGCPYGHRCHFRHSPAPAVESY
ncbi:putative zinc finger CCCH domain-containing protein 21 [Lolium rigidum]|uniref:putative zinc finger CCCH domain-containing protein 21 n=1 Tax=Lolium rigidum TaxID=89674 RepID=UPI001F5D9A67|nr:putative zinc finger CCCH domain-containing protein 21 [Lolium rigidum]